MTYRRCSFSRMAMRSMRKTWLSLLFRCLVCNKWRRLESTSHFLHVIQMPRANGSCVHAAVNSHLPAWRHVPAAAVCRCLATTTRGENKFSHVGKRDGCAGEDGVRGGLAPAWLVEGPVKCQLRFWYPCHAADLMTGRASVMCCCKCR